jgi:hypothetical protein
MSTSRAWGLGLMALGGVVGALFALWLLSRIAIGHLDLDGAVLGLVLIAVLAGPLLGGGYFLWRRSAVEEREESRFEARRRLLEGDRLFRQQAATDLRGFADRLPESPDGRAVADRLRDLAVQVERVRRDESAWYEADPLADEDLPTLRRYEDTLQAESDRLADLVSRARQGESATADLTVSLDRWERAFRQREALLVRGRRGPTVDPGELLRARTPSRGVEALRALKLGDAVTVDFQDYLVHGILTYFAQGRTWHLFILRSGSSERWLWGGPGGLTWAVLDPLPTPPAAGAPNLDAEGATLNEVESGTATADLATVAGAEQGVAVDYWRYSGADRQMAWVERWPREVRAGVGRETLADTIDVWPQAPPDAS